MVIADDERPKSLRELSREWGLPDPEPDLLEQPLPAPVRSKEEGTDEADS